MCVWVGGSALQGVWGRGAGGPRGESPGFLFFKTWQSTRKHTLGALGVCVCVCPGVLTIVRNPQQGLQRSGEYRRNSPPQPPSSGGSVGELRES